jgi:hypothetical protein
MDTLTVTEVWTVRDCLGHVSTHTDVSEARIRMELAASVSGGAGIYAAESDGVVRLIIKAGNYPATRGGDVPRNTERAPATTSNELGRK